MLKLERVKQVFYQLGHLLSVSIGYCEHLRHPDTKRNYAAAALRPEQEESGSEDENEEDSQPQQEQSQSQQSQSDAPKKIPHLELVGAGNSVEGCDCIIVTDIVDTARALSEAAMFLKAKGGELQCFF